MNTYLVKKVPFDRTVEIVSEFIEIQGYHPGHAYQNYLTHIKEEFTTLQEDNIGSTDNPCVRFISVSKATKEKFLFYIKRQNPYGK